MRLAKALIRLRVCAGWSEALLVAHTTLFFYIYNFIFPSQHASNITYINIYNSLNQGLFIYIQCLNFLFYIGGGVQLLWEWVLSHMLYKRPWNVHASTGQSCYFNCMAAKILHCWSSHALAHFVHPYTLRHCRKHHCAATRAQTFQHDNVAYNRQVLSDVTKNNISQAHHVQKSQSCSNIRRNIKILFSHILSDIPTEQTCKSADS